MLLDVVNDHVLRKLRTTTGYVTACPRDQCGGDLSVGATCSPIGSDGIGLFAQVQVVLSMNRLYVRVDSRLAGLCIFLFGVATQRIRLAGAGLQIRSYVLNKLAGNLETDLNLLSIENWL